MSIIKGAFMNKAWLNQIQYSIPATYSIVKIGSYYYGIPNFPDGTQYNDYANFTTLATDVVNAVSARGGGKIFIAGGETYTGDITLKSKCGVFGEGYNTYIDGSIDHEANATQVSIEFLRVSGTTDISKCTESFKNMVWEDTTLLPTYVSMNNSIPRAVIAGTGKGVNNQPFFDGEWIVCAVRQDLAEEACEFSFWETIGYGTYEWKAKLENPVAKTDIFLGFVEEYAGQYTDSIFLECLDGTYYFRTRKAGALTSTALAGQDWTSERTFKVIWSATSAELFVDDVSKATHNTNVPTVNGVFFIEAYHYDAVAPASGAKAYFKDFKKLA